ncbi:alanine racemase [Lactobacillus selangorensis]|uniref:Alanine racemase n=1 Tax=Lactobacillus selangorensis TaxID=81857 RepID=A0A0R2FQF8_9LACO|nr:alanine racemase [Lactobacillus selangorensis]KRN27881.1 alanine racemase [Lactobacillus selangorensis]KRN30648.1 alanine racemase [Lactobacillus selangorensis]
MTTVGNLRPTKAIIDRQAIYDNVQQEIKRLDKGTELWAVVKANAYGHGLIQVAKTAKAAGATGFCVAILDEAMSLREAHLVEPILVLGIIAPQTAPIAAANNIAVPVGSLEWLQRTEPILERQAHQLPPLRIQFALDTGMGRIGFRTTDEIKAAADFVAAHPEYFSLEGVWTHFATADEADTTYFNQQVAAFKELLAALPEQPRYVHVSNSATSLWHQACNGNVIRFGVAMYGLNPSGGALEPPYPLEPALSLVSQLVFVKQVHAGDHIGYGATYEADDDQWIGTVPIGYADGWLRRLQGFYVLVDGQKCPIVGRICMDQLMVRLPKEYVPGTDVVLVGKSGSQTLSLQDVADYSHTIHYEIACDLQERVPRHYVGPSFD